MVKIFLNGLYLGTVNLKAYGYTVKTLETCGYRVEVI